MFYYLCLWPRYSGQAGAMPLKQARIKSVTFQLDDSAPYGLFLTHGAVQEVMTMDCIWLHQFPSFMCNLSRYVTTPVTIIVK